MNQTVVEGNVGNDPELRYTQSGDAFVRLSVADNRPRRSGDGWEDDTQWINATFWRNSAERAAKTILKGDTVIIIGEMRLRSYTDQSGEPRTSLDLNVAKFRALGRRQFRERNGEAAPQHEGQRYEPAAETEPAPAQNLEDLPW